MQGDEREGTGAGARRRGDRPSERRGPGRGASTAVLGAAHLLLERAGTRRWPALERAAGADPRGRHERPGTRPQSLEPRRWRTWAGASWSARAPPPTRRWRWRFERLNTECGSSEPAVAARGPAPRARAPLREADDRGATSTRAASSSRPTGARRYEPRVHEAARRARARARRRGRARARAPRGPPPLHRDGCHGPRRAAGEGAGAVSCPTLRPSRTRRTRASARSAAPPSSEICPSLRRANCSPQAEVLPTSAEKPLGDPTRPRPPERDPRDYTPRHLADKILQLEVRPRGRAQAGDRPLRRREGLAGAGRAGRPRGVAPHPRPLLPDPGRRRAPLRGHGQPVHGRRHHGALRRAHRPRGPRAAGLLRGAAPARRAAPLRRRAEARRRASDFSVRMGINSGEVVVGKIGDDLRMDYTAQGHTVGLAARMEQLRRAGQRLPDRAHAPRWSRASSSSTISAPFELEGRRASRCAVFELEGVGRAAHAPRRVARARGFSRFVGRERRDGEPRGRAGSGPARATARWWASWARPESARAASASSSPSAAGRAGSRVLEAHGRRAREERSRSSRCSSSSAPSSGSRSGTTIGARGEKIAGTPAAARRGACARRCPWSSTSSAFPIRSARPRAMEPEARQRQLFARR